MSELIEIPSSVAASDEWCALEEEQRLSLLRRLDKVRALGESLHSGKRFAEFPDFVDFAEELELDVAILQELDVAHQGGLSRWLLHYSWSFETTPSEMSQSLPSSLAPLIDAREPQHASSIEEYRNWLQDFGGHLVLVVDEFRAAKTYASAIGIHVVLDILLTRLLLACYKLRLNRLLAR